MLDEFHWYVGAVPPLVGVAVNVTLVPLQICPDGTAATVTDGVTVGVIDMAITFEVAVVGFPQAALLVRITETLSPLFKVVELKVEPVPALVPFTCH